MTDEWQPVRIAPRSIASRCPEWVDDDFPWPEMKIVRVRLLSDAAPCGAIHLEIHPADDFEPLGCAICEHKVLAD